MNKPLVAAKISTPVDFHMTVLGRTLEHLGVQMYKRRDAALAELVANCWDAGAKEVRINIPDASQYDMLSSNITIIDDGAGMTSTQVESEYLVVGRNRRGAGTGIVQGRAVIGKKGIGKLAGFGVASRINVTTWRDGKTTEFVLDIEKLKLQDAKAEPVLVEGKVTDQVPLWAKSKAGTHVALEQLKHKSALDPEKLKEAFARRFSRKIRGEMAIYVNGDLVGEPALDFDERFPDDGYASFTLPSGATVKYQYGFTKETIKSPELRGFTIYVRGKTAQAPPFFFNVEGTASGQHGTKYLSGSIEADFLDEKQEDLISTDRQEIDWESTSVKELLEWGESLTRKALRDCADRKGQEMRDWILKDAVIGQRIEQLDPASRKQVTRFLTILGEAEPDKDRALDLADSLVRAYEYRHFHDVIDALEAIGDDPDKLNQILTMLREWKVLESRAILEIIKGRLDIVEKFHQLIVNDAPETASKQSRDNMHDLIAGYPWILNPEWQVLAEEKSISKQLQEWNYEDIQPDDHRMRYDFLALTDERRLIVIEIKRANYAVPIEDLQRLERYKERLSKAHKKEIHMVLVHGGTLDVTEGTERTWKDRPDGEIRTWSDIYSRVRNYYQHYRAVLEGNVEDIDFARKEREVSQTRSVLSSGNVRRDPQQRKAGLGPQDFDYSDQPTDGALESKKNP
jgi:hypothetical protein